MAGVNTAQIGHAASRQSINPFGKAIQGIAATIGLASETIHHHKRKRASQQSGRDSIPRSLSNDEGIHTTDEHNPSPHADLEAEPQKRLLTPVDDVAWARDEVRDDIGANNCKAAQVPADHSPLGSQELAGENFLQNHPSADGPAAPGRLGLPVVITQRRPKARTRGFIRAYAPVLKDVGIDQEAFLDFIDQLNKAVEPSPWISAIDLASLAGHAFPEPIHLLISASALMATQITTEVVSRSKSNAFLDKMNRDFFRPKGLIALVVTWKPKQEGAKQNPTGIIDIDMSAAAASKRSLEDAPARLKRRDSIMMPSAGEMVELPEFAPLVFPQEDATPRPRGPQSPGSPEHRRGTQRTGVGDVVGGVGQQQETTKSTRRARARTPGGDRSAQRAEPGCLPALRRSTAGTCVGPAARQVKLGGMSAGAGARRAGRFVSDYQDRRAVAKWSGRHPESRMAKLAPEPGFRSRFADPNHPAASGDLVALVTGGRRTAAELGREGMMRVRSTTGRAGLGVGGGEDGGGGVPRRVISLRAKEALVAIRPRGDWLPRLPHNTATAGVAPRLRGVGSLPLGAPVRTMKKLLQPDIIYLMIVNLPTEEDIAHAAACLNEETKAEEKGVENSFEDHD